MVFSIGGKAKEPPPIHPQQRPEFLKKVAEVQERRELHALKYREGVQKLSQEMQNIAARNKSAAETIRANARAGKPLLEK